MTPSPKGRRRRDLGRGPGEHAGWEHGRDCGGQVSSGGDCWPAPWASLDSCE